MSELLVNTIKKADGTGSLSVPAESGTVVTTASPSLGRRNLIINGAMQVAQRGTSTTSDNGYCVDRFVNYQAVGTFTAEQSTDAPTGFSYSLKRTNGTGVTTSGSEYSLIRYRCEGYDVAHLNLASSDAIAFTLSFWVKSSVTGTYIVGFSDGNENVQYPAQYTINSANTWEHKTVTLTGYTGSSGTWSTTNGEGLNIHWDLGSGPDRQAPTANAWNETATNWSHSSQVDWVGTTGATFYLTGVQLEVGSVATPFEHRSYGEELALCQRYYEVIGGDVEYSLIGFGSQRSTTQTNFNVNFKQPKRAVPTVSYVDNIIVTDRLNYDQAVSSLSQTYPSTFGFHGQFTHSAVGAPYRPHHVTSATASPFGYMKFDSEL